MSMQSTSSCVMDLVAGVRFNGIHGFLSKNKRRGSTVGLFGIIHGTFFPNSLFQALYCLKWTLMSLLIWKGLSNQRILLIGLTLLLRHRRDFTIGHAKSLVFTITVFCFSSWYYKIVDISNQQNWSHRGKTMELLKVLLKSRMFEGFYYRTC